MITIEFHTTTSAFDTYPEAEVEAVLGRAVRDVLQCGIAEDWQGPLLDSNGNTIGFIRVTTDPTSI